MCTSLRVRANVDNWAVVRGVFRARRCVRERIIAFGFDEARATRFIADKSKFWSTPSWTPSPPRRKTAPSLHGSDFLVVKQYLSTKPTLRSLGLVNDGQRYTRPRAIFDARGCYATRRTNRESKLSRISPTNGRTCGRDSLRGNPHRVCGPKRRHAGTLPV